MKHIHIVVEGSSEESFVRDVLTPHFAKLNKFISVRRIQTGWDSMGNRPAKGGLLKYRKFRNDVMRWIESDNNRPNTYYTSFIDLYAFPVDSESPYTANIQAIADKYQRIAELERAIGDNINDARFIPYVQLHEFETFILVDIDQLSVMYPDKIAGLRRLKQDVGSISPELVNDSIHTAPSKRIIKFFPEYEGQKAQVGPLIAQDIGLTKLRENCPHFDKWMSKLETL